MKTARIVFRPGNSTPHSYKAQVAIGAQLSGVATLNFIGQDIMADFPIDWPSSPDIYDIKVSLRETSGALVWEKTAGQVTVPITVPPAPSPLLPVNGSVINGTSITFSWNAVAGATNYMLTVVKASDHSIFFSQQVGNVTSYTVTGFPNDGTMYYWSIEAYNSAGWGTSELNLNFTNGAPLTSLLKDSLVSATGDNNVYPYLGQFFTAGSAYHLTRISIPMKARAAGQGLIQIQLQHMVDAPDLPSLVPGYPYMLATLATSINAIDSSILTNSYVWYDFDLPEVALSAGGLYLIRPTSYFFWQSGQVPYSGGGAFYMDYAYPYAISVSNSYNFNFKIYGR